MNQPTPPDLSEVTEAIGLPAPTQHLLLVAACATAEDLELFLAGLDEEALAAWIPAEAAGLVRIGAEAGVPLRWGSPETPELLLQAATYVDRRRAHLALAASLGARPDRAAWHRAAVQLGPDEEVAAALEASVALTRRHGGWPAEAETWERAAELSSDPEAAARRYVLAAHAAMLMGDGSRVSRLGERAFELTDGSAVAVEASIARGWAMTRTVRHAEAVPLLVATAVRASGLHEHALAWGALAPAAVGAYYSGRAELHDQVAAAFEIIRRGDPEAAQRPSPTWLSAFLDPIGAAADVGAVLDGLGPLAELNASQLNQYGGAAWMVDRPDIAVPAFRALIDARDRMPGAAADALVRASLGAALSDLARWEEAEQVLEATSRLAQENGMELIERVVSARLALISASRGEATEARERASRSVVGLDPDPRLSVAVLARWATGLAALGEGDHERAYEILRATLDDALVPRHAQQSLYVMTDLVVAGLRTGREAEAARIASLQQERVRGGSARLRQRAWHATAIVAAAAPVGGGAGSAEEAFRNALADPHGAQWAFDRARVLLDLGRWLRRERRNGESRPHLAAAHDLFHRIGAAPWERRAAVELRALGVRGVDRGGAFGELTPQQQEIVRMAAAGLSNKEIAERLVLSPRTVSSHLYRAFPRLGITGRGQLRDVLPD